MKVSAAGLRNRYKNRLCAPFDIDGKTLYVGSSCGYAAYPNDASTANEIRILADQRMYTEKEKTSHVQQFKQLIHWKWSGK